MPGRKRSAKEELDARLALLQSATTNTIQRMGWSTPANQFYPVAGGQVSPGLELPQEEKFDCGNHAISYMAFKAGCPLCKSEREMSRMRQTLKETLNRMALLDAENRKLKVDVDLIFSIQEAADLLDDADMEFFKLSLYQWRDKKTVSLKVTHGGKGKKRTVNGFIRMHRSQDPLGYLCTSVGGLAIASYFEEAMNSAGPAKAMEILARGLARHLPGSTQ